MGFIICPDGLSVPTDKLDRHMPYEFLVRNLKDEKWSVHYRAACIKVIGDIGMYANCTSDLIPYLHKLAAEEQDESLKTAAVYTLQKISPNFKG